MQVKKNDFIEIEFTGKVDDKIFDTTNKKEAKEMGLEDDVKPVIISVGNQMLLKGLEEEIEGKEIGKKYKIKLQPEKAFGKRDPSLIKTTSMKTFREKNMNPVPGMTLQMDNHIAKVLSVSGGRVIIDFNNPLAGKEVEYDFKITKQVESNKEKVNALQDFFFRQRFEFEIKDNKVIFKENKIKQIIDMFKPKFKEITGLEFEVGEEKKQVEKKQNKENTTKPQ